MSVYEVQDVEFDSLKGRTILITGGASGIGRATVLLAHSHGANVVIGDIDEEGGIALAEELQSRVFFKRCDVSQWNDVLTLFQEGYNTFGAIDVVAANAGTTEYGELLHDEFDEKTGKLLAPNLKTMTVNFDGAAFTVKCAAHWFAKDPEKKHQIIITASAAGFLETPPIHLYSSSKTALIGLVRSLRSQLPKSHNTTINLVAPWMTKTKMLPESIVELWGDLPANEPIGVARAILLPAVQQEVNGCLFFIAGHQIVDFEEGLLKTQPGWMGEALSEHVNEGQRRMFGLLA